MLRHRHQVGEVGDAVLGAILLLRVSGLVVELLLGEIVVELQVNVLLEHRNFVTEQRVWHEIGLQNGLVVEMVVPSVVDQWVELGLDKLTIIQVLDHETVVGVLLGQLLRLELGLGLGLGLRLYLGLRVRGAGGLAVGLEVDLVLVQLLLTVTAAQTHLVFTVVRHVEGFGTTVTITHFLEVGPSDLVVFTAPLAHFELARGLGRNFAIGDDQAIQRARTVHTLTLGRSIGLSGSEILSTRWAEHKFLLVEGDFGPTPTAGPMLVFGLFLPPSGPLTLEVSTVLTELEYLWLYDGLGELAVLGDDNVLVKALLASRA